MMDQLPLDEWDAAVERLRQRLIAAIEYDVAEREEQSDE